MIPSAAPLASSKSKQSSGGGCGGTGASAGLLPPDQGLKCPRCSSPNTKFCYYNNYSLTQPRHFCKSCRRYWTKGGALRSVPVGGGCRKSKNAKSSSSASSSVTSSSSSFSLMPLETLTNAMPVLEPTVAAASAANIKFLTQTSMDVHVRQNFSAISTSIESLSSMNQDLHWRLQQQRLVTLLGGEEEAQKQSQAFAVEGGTRGDYFGDHSHHTCAATGFRKSTSEAEGTAWFLDGSFAAMNDEANVNTENGAGDWNGITDWSEAQQFTVLP